MLVLLELLLTLSGIADAFTRTETAEPVSPLGTRSVMVTGDGEVEGTLDAAGGASQQSSLAQTDRELEFLDPDSGIQEIVKVDVVKFMAAANRLPRHPSDRITSYRNEVALLTSYFHKTGISDGWMGAWRSVWHPDEEHLNAVEAWRLAGIPARFYAVQVEPSIGTCVAERVENVDYQERTKICEERMETVQEVETRPEDYQEGSVLVAKRKEACEVDDTCYYVHDPSWPSFPKGDHTEVSNMIDKSLAKWKSLGINGKLILEDHCTWLDPMIFDNRDNQDAIRRALSTEDGYEHKVAIFTCNGFRFGDRLREIFPEEMASGRLHIFPIDRPIKVLKEGVYSYGRTFNAEVTGMVDAWLGFEVPWHRPIIRSWRDIFSDHVDHYLGGLMNAINLDEMILW